MPKFPRVHAFVNALSEAGGYAGGADGRGYTIKGHWSEDQLDHAIAATAPLPTNLDDAIAIVDQIDRVRAVQRELKAAFARSELDGGAKAAVDHPLYLEAAAKLEELHDEMMGLI